MLECHECIRGPAADALISTDDVVLNYDQRKKSRLRVYTRSGVELGLFLPRGTVLHHDDVLIASNGNGIRVLAAEELVSQVNHADMLLLTRAAYHLGNRHVPLQMGPGWLRYQHDHVLDDMLRGLGLEVVVKAAPFHPEDGAYSGGGHHHGHSHHDHEHEATPRHRYVINTGHAHGKHSHD